MTKVPFVPPGSLLETEGGVNAGPSTYGLSSRRASACSSGVKSITSLRVMPNWSYAGGLVGNGCVGHECSPGTVDRGVPKVRRHQVVIPHVVVDQLIMPDQLARLAIETNQGVGKQILARPLPAVQTIVRRGQPNIDVSQGLIDAEAPPGIQVARKCPGVVAPRLAPKIARRRHHVKGPTEAAGSDVETTDIVRYTFPFRAGVLVPVRSGEDDDVADDDGGAGPGIVASPRAIRGAQVHASLDAEVRKGLARFRVERLQVLAARNEDALF